MDYSSVVILGGGLAGAGCAQQLPGAQIFESKPYLGGHAYSHTWKGYHFDEGAHICHSRDEAFLSSIEVPKRGDIHQVVSKTGNWDRGRWFSYPIQNNLYQLPADERIPALSDFVRAQIEKKNPPENYEQWCRAQYGDTLTDTYYKRYTDKYWRTTMAQMDIDWLSGRLLPSQVDRVIAGSVASQEENQPVFSKFIYPRQGGFMGLMQPLFNSIKATLNERAVSIDLKQRRVTFASGRTESFEQLVSTIPLPTLINIIKDCPTHIKDATAKLQWTQLICVDFIINRPAVTPYHWFYLYDTDIETSRVSVPTNLSGSTGPHTAIQAEVFRNHNETFNADAIGELTLKQLTKVLNYTADEVIDARTNVCNFSYVTPFLGHAAVTQGILDWLEQQGIFPAGLHGRWKYVWSDAAYRSGEDAAQKIQSLRSSTK